MRVTFLLALMGAAVSCFGSLSGPLPAQADSDTPETSLTVTKRVQFWKKRFCAADEICLPAPFGMGAEFSGTLDRPPGTGQVTQLKHTFSDSSFRVELFVYWTRPRDAAAVDYLVTQIRFFHDTEGLIAECSRYDDARSTLAIATGSCSGRFEGEQVGVSFANP